MFIYLDVFDAPYDNYWIHVLMARYMNLSFGDMSKFILFPPFQNQPVFKNHF